MGLPLEGEKAGVTARISTGWPMGRDGVALVQGPTERREQARLRALLGPAPGRGANKGIIFQLTPPSLPGGEWTEAILHTFTGPDGSYPSATMTPGPAGVLYGATGSGGAAYNGTIFEVMP